MRIDSAVDERRDPYRSSEAAARLLKANYGELDSWPLAITAYNHGTGGMRRAMRAVGTDNIETIVRNYDGPPSASRRATSMCPSSRPRKSRPMPRSTSVPSGATRREAHDHPGAGLPERQHPGADAGRAARDAAAYNPSLLPTIWMGKKYVPRGYSLRLPDTVSDADARLAAIPGASAAARRPAIPGRAPHRVRSGETLSGIAARYRTSPAASPASTACRSAT